jgi:hypothetical protein
VDQEGISTEETKSIDDRGEEGVGGVDPPRPRSENASGWAPVGERGDGVDPTVTEAPADARVWPATASAEEGVEVGPETGSGLSHVGAADISVASPAAAAASPTSRTAATSASEGGDVSALGAVANPSHVGAAAGVAGFSTVAAATSPAPTCRVTSTTSAGVESRIASTAAVAAISRVASTATVVAAETSTRVSVAGAAVAATTASRGFSFRAAAATMMGSCRDEGEAVPGASTQRRGHQEGRHCGGRSHTDWRWCYGWRGWRSR